jgi:tight adherence protein C
MTATLVAALAALLAAAGAAELAASAPAAPRRRVRPRRGARLAGVELLARLGRRIAVGAPDAGLEARLAAAGRPLGLTVTDVLALRGAGAVLGLALAVPVSAAAPGRLGLLVALAGPVAGLLAPDLALRRRAARRASAMTLELADVLELLRVAVDAGQTPARALAEVGRRHRGALAAELARAARQLALGVPRADALAGLAARAPLPGVVALVAAVERAERHGAPLTEALASLATEARAERARAVRDHAARAAPKIQLVVALLLVPAVLLLVAAALAAAFL